MNPVRGSKRKSPKVATSAINSSSQSIVKSEKSIHVLYKEPPCKIPKAEEPDLCTICLEILSQKERSVLQSCNHAFCFDCIYKWLQRRRACPLCNAEPREIMFSIQSALKYRVAEPPDLQCTCQMSSHRIHRQKRVRLFGLENCSDTSIRQLLPEIFLKTVMRKTEFRSRTVDRLIYYLVDPIELLPDSIAESNPSEASSSDIDSEWKLAEDFFKFIKNELSLFSLNISNIMAFSYVTQLLHDSNDTNLLSKHCIDFHCCLNGYLPLKIVKKLWAMLLYYIGQRRPAEKIVFRFGLRQTTGDEELFPGKEHPERAEATICDVIVEHFKLVMQSATSLSKCIYEQVHQLVSFPPNSIYPEIMEISKRTIRKFLFSYMKDMVHEHLNRGASPIVAQWACLYQLRRKPPSLPTGALSEFNLHDTDPENGSSLTLMEPEQPSGVLPTTDSADLRSRMISVIDRLHIQRHLRSEQYQRNRIRNFMALQKAEEPTEGVAGCANQSGSTSQDLTVRLSQHDDDLCTSVSDESTAVLLEPQELVALPIPIYNEVFTPSESLLSIASNGSTWSDSPSSDSFPWSFDINSLQSEPLSSSDLQNIASLSDEFRRSIEAPNNVIHPTMQAVVASGKLDAYLQQHPYY